MSDRRRRWERVRVCVTDSLRPTVVCYAASKTTCTAITWANTAASERFASRNSHTLQATACNFPTPTQAPIPFVAEAILNERKLEQATSNPPTDAQAKKRRSSVSQNLPHTKISEGSFISTLCTVHLKFNIRQSEKNTFIVYLRSKSEISDIAQKKTFRHQCRLFTT